MLSGGGYEAVCCLEGPQAQEVQPPRGCIPERWTAGTLPGAPRPQELLLPRRASSGLWWRLGVSSVGLCLTLALALWVLSPGPLEGTRGVLSADKIPAFGRGVPGSGAFPGGKFSLLPTHHFSIFELVVSAYRKLSGSQDPFLFQCPLPLPMHAGGPAVRSSCCRAYESLSWPYQFPECANFSRCPSCFLSSGEQVLMNHPGAQLAGAAWAAVVTTKEHAEAKWNWVASSLHRKVSGLLSHSPGTERVEGRQMLASLGSGLHKSKVDLCPRIRDWTMSVLDEEEQNIRARIFKSDSAKLAILAFRGTQATSLKNWQVDADIERVGVHLGPDSAGPVSFVHKGFLSALEPVLPQVKRWAGGYTFLHIDDVPEDWTLVFAGHSLGGALALLAATKAEAEGWNRRPDMTVIWGAPRVADKNLNHWWESRGLCRKLLRVNTENDVIHWFPFKRMWSWWTVFTDVFRCATQAGDCKSDVAFSDTDRWMHVCNQSEVVVPAAMKGLNEHMQDFSSIGAILSHFVSNCLFGYGYGVMHGGIASHDAHCGIGPQMCPRFT